MSTKTKDSRAFLGNNNNHMAKKPDEEVISEDEVYCGIGGCRPTALQCCATMGVFSAMYSLSGLLTSTVSIYINSQITTLEKQFGFSSSVSGFLLSCNDIGYLLTTLAMSYIARRTHIPRVLGLSTILFGVSGLICSIPYFATKNDLHPWVNSTGMNTSWLLGGRLCTIGQSHSISNFSDGDTCLDRLDSASIANIPESTRSFAIALIAIGMILQGFGKSPRYPFIATYVDDNVEKTKTTLYLGKLIHLYVSITKASVPNRFSSSHWLKQALKHSTAIMRCENLLVDQRLCPLCKQRDWEKSSYLNCPVYDFLRLKLLLNACYLKMITVHFS